MALRPLLLSFILFLLMSGYCPGAVLSDVSLDETEKGEGEDRFFTLYTDGKSERSHLLIGSDSLADLRFNISVLKAVQDKYNMLLITPELLFSRDDTTSILLDHLALSGGIYSFVRDRQSFFTELYRSRYKLRDLLDSDMEQLIVDKVVSTHYGNSKILDTTLSSNQDIIYSYRHLLPLRDSLSRVYITLRGEVFNLDDTQSTLSSIDTLEYCFYRLSDFIDHRPLYIHRPIPVAVPPQSHSYRLFFSSDGTSLDLTIPNNKQSLHHIDSILDLVLRDETSVFSALHISSSSSPIGKISYNEHLSKERGSSLYRHIANRIGDIAADSLITVSSHGENWKDLISFIAQSNLPNGPDFLKVISSYFDNGKDIDGLEWLELRKFPDYPILRAQAYPLLQQVTFSYTVTHSRYGDSTLVETLLDESHSCALELLADGDYASAIPLLKEYNDINYAVCLIGLSDYKSAKKILENLPSSNGVTTLRRLVDSLLPDIYIDPVKTPTL